MTSTSKTTSPDGSVDHSELCLCGDPRWKHKHDGPCQNLACRCGCFRSTHETMSGREAYERDVSVRPTYHDGASRKTWNQLSDLERSTWERNPTSRA